VRIRTDSRMPSDPLLRTIDDARLLQRLPAREMSVEAGYDPKLWHNWLVSVPQQIRALQDVAEVLGLEIVVRPKSLDSTGSGRQI
jgi:hypothetical protein